MAENTKQYRWIVKIKEGIESLFADDANVFVAADLFWYPVEKKNMTKTAPLRFLTRILKCSGILPQESNKK